MRVAFQHRLAEISAQLGALGTDVVTAIQNANTAVLNCDLARAESALSDARDISDAARVLAESTTTIIAQQQPVAHDLRLLIGVQKATWHLDLMGQEAAGIARLARRRFPVTLPLEAQGVLQDCAVLASDMGLLSVLAARQRRRPLPQGGATMRRLHDEMLLIVDSPAWPHGTAGAVTFSLITTHYVRFADQAEALGSAVVNLDR